MNYYDLLEVLPTASIETIEAAYRAASKKHHSDITGGDDEEMKCLNAAIEVLRDPQRRTEYDKVNKRYSEVTVKSLSPTAIRPFHKKLFQPYTGERLEDLIDSIKAHGIIIPVIVRRIERDAEGYDYELLAGHNRREAAQRVGYKTIPCIIKEKLSEEEALIYVVETNAKQRSFKDMLPTEQALVLALRCPHMFSQKKYEYIKADLEALENKTASQIGASTRSLGKEYSLSKSNIARLIRINHLIDSLKARVDAGNIAVYAAVDLSYLSTSEQEFIESVLAKDDKFKVDMKKAALLREYSGKLTYETAYDMISGKIKGELKEKTVKTINIDIEVYEKYFNGKSKKEAEDLIIQAIVEYFENRGGHESTESAPSDENKSEQAGDSKEMDESESIKGVGTKVKIKDLSRDEEVEYILVDSSKVDPRNKKISPESPLGEVLINSKKGDIKEYKTRAKGKEPDKIRIQILEFWNSWNDAS